MAPRRSVAGVAFWLTVGVLATAVGWPVQPVETSARVGEVTAGRGWAHAEAFDGGFIATWEDGRRHTTLTKSYGARMTNAGALLDPEGLPLGVGEWIVWDPAVACGPSDCLVVVSDGLRGLTARTLSPATGALGPVSLLPATAGVLTQPTLAFNGTDYLLAWAESAGVRAVFVSPQGQQSGAAFDVISAGALSTSYARLVHAAGSYLLAWLRQTTPGPSLMATVLDAAGAPKGQTLDFGPVDQYFQPGVATDGVRFVVVWSDGSDVFGQRVASTGLPIDLAPVALAGTTSREAYPTVGFDGANFVVAHVTDWDKLTLRRFAPASLAPVGAGQLLLTSRWSVQGPWLAFNAQRGFVTWAEQRFPLEPWFGSMLLDTLGVSAPLDAGYVRQTGVERADSPRAAWTGQHWEVVYGAHLDRTGAPSWIRLTPTGTRVAGSVQVGATTDFYCGADVASSLLYGLAAWSTGDTVYARELNGAPPSSTVHTLGSGSWFTSAPATAQRGAKVGVLWGAQSAADGDALYLREHRAGFGPVDGGAGRIHTVSNARLLKVGLAAGDGGYLVSWLEDLVLKAAWVAVGGQVGDGGATLDTTVDSHASAAGTNTFLVAWNSGFDDGVYAARFDEDGALLDAAPLQVQPRTIGYAGLINQSAPSVAFDGRSYQVAWGRAIPYDGGHPVMVRRVFEDGGLGAPVVVAPAAGEREKIHIAAGTPGRTLVTWQEYEPTLGAVRLRARVLAEVPLLAQCWRSDECTAGSCVAGYCCPTAEPCVGADGGAGLPDGGAPADGGAQTDGGTAPDGGAPDPAAPVALRVACGCGAAEGAPWLSALLLGLRVAARGRGRQRPGASARG